MIIDAHTHVSIDGHKEKDVPHLLAAMDAAGIDMSAVFAATINDLTTEDVLAKIAGHRDRLFAVGTVSPILAKFMPALETVDGWLAHGCIRGLKFYTGYEHFYPADERLRPYMELLAKHGRPAIFHCGDLYDRIPGSKLKYAHPLAIDDLASDMPELKIVIAHIGSPWVVDAAQVCYKNRNVYADCSGFVYGTFDDYQVLRFTRYWREFDEIVEGASSDKILFGTDWPISDVRSYLAVVRNCVRNTDEYERVCRANAESVFGL